MTDNLLQRAGRRCHAPGGRCALRRTLVCTRATAASPAQLPLPAPPFASSIFVFGLGYTSVGLANCLAAAGWSVSGTCRTPERVEALLAKGWNVGAFDPARGVSLSPELRDRLAHSPYVLSSIPPLALAMYDPALAAQKALVRPLAPTWLGYLSSTSVYGDWQGEWVDEETPCRQSSSKGIMRQEAEAAWMELHAECALPVHVFRLGGIYGPGRSVLDSLNAESSDLSAAQQRRGRQRYTSRCHVYDICAVLVASMAQPGQPPAVYNVVDDDPAPRNEVASYARALVHPEASAAAHAEEGRARAAGEDGAAGGAAAAVPAGSPGERPLASTGAGTASAGCTRSADGGGGGGKGEAEGTEAAGRGAARRASRLEEKRVRNRRIRDELGVVMTFPTYREGIAAIHRGETAPLYAEDLAAL